MANENKKTIGDWTWNSQVLWSKIVDTDPDSCWAWLGAVGPQTNLFGVRKNGKAQMTQARRILYRDVYNEDCDDLQIRHTCGNKYCMNPHHFSVLPNQQRFRHDGTDRTLPLPEPVRPVLPKAILKPVNKQQRWWTV